jgi:hypothetical protein
VSRSCSRSRGRATRRPRPRSQRYMFDLNYEPVDTLRYDSASFSNFVDSRSPSTFVPEDHLEYSLHHYHAHRFPTSPSLRLSPSLAPPSMSPAPGFEDHPRARRAVTPRHDPEKRGTVFSCDRLFFVVHSKPMVFTFSVARVRSPRRELHREQRDSGYGRSVPRHSRDRSPPAPAPRSTKTHVDPCKDSIKSVWEDSRQFEATLTDEAHSLLKQAFDLSAVPP